MVAEVCFEIIFIRVVLFFMVVVVEYPITVNVDNMEVIFPS